MPKIGKHSRLLIPEMLILIVIVFLVGMALGYLGARAKYKGDLIATTTVAMNNSDKLRTFNQMMSLKAVDGGVVMRNRQMYLVRDDNLSKMNSSIMLKDGSKVNVDGGVVRPSGAQFKLGEGLGVTLDGQAVVVFQTE